MNFFKPKQRQVDNWKRIVERGKWKFISVNLIAFGINMMLFVFAFEYLMQQPENLTDILTPETTLMALAAGAVGGSVFAFGSWFIGNWRYRKHLKG